MVATFCLRLASGLIASLLVLNPAPIHPRFFRVHYLSALGLLAVAGFFMRGQGGLETWIGFGLGMLLCFLGSISWHVEGHPGASWILGLAAPVLLGVLLLARSGAWNPWFIADDLAGAAVLGSATTAMLLGHSYLLAPAMSIAPLMRLLGLLGVSLVLRLGLAAAGCYSWTRGHSPGNLDTETLLWLGARWVLGFIGPLVLGWMAYETARLRSTQSATGILYVVVIVAFLGELTSLLLLEKTLHVL